MKADTDDAPSYLSRTLPQKLKTWAIPTVLGTATCLGLLYWAGSLMPTPLRVFHTPTPPPAREWKESPPLVNTAPARIEQIQNTEPPHERQAARPEAVISPYVERATEWGEGPKQTVFNDQNYMPRGAVNTVRMETSHTTRKERDDEKLTVKGIKESRRIRDFCPNPSSIEGRNCRQRWGLNSRK